MFGFPDDDLPGLPRHTPTQHPMPCPLPGVLLAYADEHDTSITPRRRARILDHVRCCEKCQMHLERAVDGVLDGVHEIYKDAYDVNQAALRRREANFRDELHAQMKALRQPLGAARPTRPRPARPLASARPLGSDHSSVSAHPFVSVHPLASGHSFKPWHSVAAIVAVVVMGVMLLRPAAVVIHAEELIERAIAYDRAHIAGLRQRVHRELSTGMMAFARTVPGMPRLTSFADYRDVVDGTVSSETRLVGVGVRDREPHAELTRLFERHHFDWRKPFCLTCYRTWRASLPRKHDTVTLTGDMLVLRTTTPDGALREVTLTFRRDSYRLVRQTFLFEGLGHIVIAELERRQAAPANQLASAAGARAAADTGTGTLTPRITSRPPAVGEPSPAALRKISLSRWLDRNFPPSASAARSAFLPDIERRSSSVRRHLIELQRLASISSSTKVKNGTDAERAMVQQRVELEYQALTTHLRALEEHLTVLFGDGSRSFEFRTPLPTDWDRRASVAMPHATRLTHRLQRLFTRDDLPPEETEASRPRSARAAFEALWESIHGENR
jgi:hypothetical protein